VPGSLFAALALASGGPAMPTPIPSLPPPVSPFGVAPLPSRGEKLGIVFPVLGGRMRRANYNDLRGSYRHTGQDIPAPKMTPILAPFEGRINMKVESFWITASSGLRCLGTHLNDDTPGTNDGLGGRDFIFAPNLRPGDRVAAGQLIGYVGDSGNATGPHLHFELHDRQGLMNPVPSLKAATRLARPSMILKNLDDKPETGRERFDLCPRGWEPESRILKGILVGRQRPDGTASIEARPTIIWIQVPEALADQDPLLASHSEDRIITAWFRREGRRLVAERLAFSED
jgi:murein DD-endopeptidase MepM/ murein hydrolase activator NlpD